MLSIRNLQILQLAHINLEIEPGQCITISGPSGCGKTKLLRAIADLDHHQGDIRLNGVPQREIPAPQWRRQVGFLPAESAWWMEFVGDHFHNPSPCLLETLGFTTDWLSREVSRLSTGERQRLALLRLLENRPTVLLLDEPTANLDNDNTQRVEQLINDYRKQQIAVIWVTHNPSQHQMGGRYYHFQDGELRQSI
ncbi:YbbL ABC transporter ATP-binding protein [hydrothermal vent metagenome]|uniref:YbbL ABC transporter ATP-binding protein n=1 Tax=hydrothermal vent metagenome TaxID=652676 RepID=A0A3B1B2A5_9ZZZZ